MGRFRLGDEVDEPLFDRRFHGDHRVVVDHRDLAGLVDLGRLAPVDDVQIVGVVLRTAGLERRTPVLDPAHVALGAERVGERPAVGHQLAGVGQVLAVGRQFERERPVGIDPTRFPVEFPVGDRAAELFVELAERREAAAEHARVLRRFDHVFRVRGHEGAAMLGLQDRVHHDLLGFEVMQADHTDARRRLVVDEQVFAVEIAVGFGDRRVVGVAPLDLAAIDLAGFEDRLGFLVEPVALPRLRREHRDVFQDPHRRHTVDHDLARLPAGGEYDEFVPAAGRRIGFRRCEQVLLGQAAGLHHLVQRLRRGNRWQGEAHRGRCRQQAIENGLGH